MTYRLLPPEEWNRLAPVVALHGERLPSLESGTAAIAEDGDGNIQGVWFFQLAFHMEPLIIMNPYVNFLRLLETMEKPIAPGTEYLAITKTDKTARMAHLAGFTELGRVWGKRKQ